MISYSATFQMVGERVAAGAKEAAGAREHGGSAAGIIETTRAGSPSDSEQPGVSHGALAGIVPPSRLSIRE